MKNISLYTLWKSRGKRTTLICESCLIIFFVIFSFLLQVIGGCSSGSTGSDNDEYILCGYYQAEEGAAGSSNEGLWFWLDDSYVLSDKEYDSRLVIGEWDIREGLNQHGSWVVDSGMVIHAVAGVVISNTTWSIDYEINDIYWEGGGVITDNRFNGTFRKYSLACDDLSRDTTFFEFEAVRRCKSGESEFIMHRPIRTFEFGFYYRQIFDQAYLNGVVVGVGKSIVRRVEGEEPVICRKGSYNKVFSAGDRFFANSNTLGLIYSFDGLDWEVDCDTSWNGFVNDLIYENGTYIASGAYLDSTIIWLSYDGVNWTRHSTNTLRYPQNLMWTGNEFVMNGTKWDDSLSGAVASSSDGLNWVTKATFPKKFIDMLWDGNRYVGLRDDTIWQSSDAVSWTSLDKPNVVFGPAVTGRTAWKNNYMTFGDTLYLLGADGGIYSSTDLINWVQRFPYPIPVRNVDYSGGKFLWRDFQSKYSSDGITWESSIGAIY